MSIWGKLAGAAAGFAMGGPLGALLGAVAGHYAVDKKSGEEARPQNRPQREIAFTIGVIALGAKMAKADGRVTRDEVDAFKQVFRIPAHEMKNVARVFNLAKKDVAGYESYATQLVGLFGKGSPVLEDVMDGLYHIAKADGVVHPGEAQFLESVAEIFGFAGADFARIRERHVEPDKEDPYVVLGVSRDMSSAQIKKAYRKLVAENHPDKHIAAGMPEEFIALATEKLAHINDAYDRIEKERGM
ncbi:MAG: molecular chaperone DjlA [Hyphomicrobiales bacterium]|nr:MAG: molecular chaperone DjlA [Hyphomicrobiales bacterium]